MRIENLRFEIGDRKTRYDQETPEKILLDIVVDAEKPKVICAKFLRDDVSKEDVAAVEGAKKTRLQEQWSIHPNPSKARFLWTTVALVPREVRLGEGRKKSKMADTALCLPRQERLRRPVCVCMLGAVRRILVM